MRNGTLSTQSMDFAVSIIQLVKELKQQNESQRALRFMWSEAEHFIAGAAGLH